MPDQLFRAVHRIDRSKTKTLHKPVWLWDGTVLISLSDCVEEDVVDLIPTRKYKKVWDKRRIPLGRFTRYTRLILTYRKNGHSGTERCEIILSGNKIWKDEVTDFIHVINESVRAYAVLKEVRKLRTKLTHIE